MKETTSIIPVNGADLHVLDLMPEGSQKAPPLVFLHDALGSIAQWGDFPHALAQLSGRRAIVYERRGHGRSSPLVLPRKDDYLHREGLEDLPALLRALDIGAPVLIGHSDGGSIALIYAAYHPAAALITEAAHVVVEETTLRGIRTAVSRREELIEKLRPYHGDQTEALFSAWADTWLRPSFRDWDIRDLLPRIDGPALVIQGADDVYGTEEQAWSIATGIGPKAQVLLIANCGHIPHRQSRPAVLRHMHKMVDRT